MSELNIYQKIQKVQEAVGPVAKESKVGGRYNATKYDTVLEVVRPSLVEQGIIMVVDVINHAILHTWEYKEKQYTLTAATAKVKFVNADNPEEVVESTVFGYGICDQDKGPGKAVTYLTKIALQKMFLLQSGDEEEIEMSQSDETSQRPASERPKSKPAKEDAPEGAPEIHKGGKWNNPISEGQSKRLYAIAMSGGLTVEELKAIVFAVAGVNDSREVTSGVYARVCWAVEEEGKSKAVAKAEETFGKDTKPTADDDDLPF
jgi:hypothetical protein